MRDIRRGLNRKQSPSKTTTWRRLRETVQMEPYCTILADVEDFFGSDWVITWVVRNNSLRIKDAKLKNVRPSEAKRKEDLHRFMWWRCVFFLGQGGKSPVLQVAVPKRLS